MVIEAFLPGEEASMLVLMDASGYRCLLQAKTTSAWVKAMQVRTREAWARTVLLRW